MLLQAHSQRRKGEDRKEKKPHQSSIIAVHEQRPGRCRCLNCLRYQTALYLMVCIAVFTGVSGPISTIPPIILFIRDKFKHVFGPNGRSDATKALVYWCRVGREEVVQRKCKPITKTINFRSKIWWVVFNAMAAFHVSVVIQWRHVGDVRKVAH